MSRETHVRFWESVEVRFLRATHHLAEVQYRFNRLVRAAAVTGPRPERVIRAAELGG